MSLEYGYLYRTILKGLQAGESMVLTTVVDSRGSTPRKAGSRMLVFSNGRLDGTVGGGSLEAVAVEYARECLGTGRSCLREFGLNGSDAELGPMRCGGKVALLFEYLAPEPEQLELYTRAARLESEEVEFTLTADLTALAYEKRKVARELVVEDKGAEGWKQALIGNKTIAERAAITLTEDRQQLIERMLPRETLYIFGAGHVGGETALLASHAGFRVRLVDDRENISRLPEYGQYGIEISILPEFQGITEKLRLSSRCYAVIATRGHLYDQRVLEQLLPLNLFYTGMMGSRSKKAAIFSSLLDKGFAQENLNRIHCPVGLEIGAETPAEIAVSIVAQLIQVKMENKNGV